MVPLTNPMKFWKLSGIVIYVHPNQPRKLSPELPKWCIPKSLPTCGHSKGDHDKPKDLGLAFLCPNSCQGAVVANVRFSPGKQAVTPLLDNNFSNTRRSFVRGSGCSSNEP